MYTAITEVLQRLHAPLDTAEMHGLLCGFLCLSQDRQNATWLDHIMDENPADTPETQQCFKVLRSLQQHVITQLQSDAFEFTPLLPADHTDLLTRVQAVARWCQGFVYGLGIGGLKEATVLSSEGREFLHDVSELTRLDANIQTDTDHELAYIHVVEYLKVGVLTLYDEHHHPTHPTTTVH